ncbi:MAG: PQQ-dependent sugar dehydrogenase [Planctomycetota bacterium]
MSCKCIIALSLCAAAALAPQTMAQTPLRAVRITTIGQLVRPLFLTALPGDTARLFILEQRDGNIGRIRIFDRGAGALKATPFLALSPVGTQSEQGLLGLAFHPAYATNGYFYVYYTDPTNTIHVVRYTVSGNPDLADPNSAYRLLQIPHPTYGNHNGGWMAFGPDGYLYIGTGDGGSGYDPSNNAQSRQARLGKLLRIDVNGDDFPADPNRNYAIPPTNPLVNDPNAAHEIWHLGLRNPWRCSFDRETGDLYIGDVGQANWEEVDFQPANSPGGLNFGWRCMEGQHCTGLTGCTCNSPELTLPIHEYAHVNNQCSITGGYVYRGYEICDLRGTYFFADYCADRIWSFRYDGVNLTEFQERTAELNAGGGITSFGEDAEGELYIVCSDGEIWKIVPGAGVPPRGDMNRDGQVNFDDINPFVLGLTDPAGYEAQYGVPPVTLGDLNCDGAFDFEDINPFVAALAGG